MFAIGSGKIYAMLLVFAPELMAYGDNPVGLTDTKALSFNAEMQKSLNKARALVKAEKIGMALGIFNKNGADIRIEGSDHTNFNFLSQRLSRFDKNIQKIIHDCRPKDMPYDVFLKETGVMDLIESCEFIIPVRPNCPDRIKAFGRLAQIFQRFQDFQTNKDLEYIFPCIERMENYFLKWVKSMCPKFKFIVTKEAEDSLIGPDGTHPNGGSQGIFKDGAILPSTKNNKGLSKEKPTKMGMGAAKNLIAEAKKNFAHRIFNNNGAHVYIEGSGDADFNFFSQELTVFSKEICRIVESVPLENVSYDVFLKEMGVMDLIESCEFIIPVGPNRQDRIKVFGRLAQIFQRFQDFQTNEESRILEYTFPCIRTIEEDFLEWVKSMCPNFNTIVTKEEGDGAIAVHGIEAFRERSGPFKFKDGAVLPPTKNNKYAPSGEGPLETELGTAKNLIAEAKKDFAHRIFNNNGADIRIEGSGDTDFNFFAQELTVFSKEICRIVESVPLENVSYDVFLKEMGVMDLIESCEYIAKSFPEFKPGHPDRIKVFSRLAQRFQDFQTNEESKILKYTCRQIGGIESDFLKWVKSMCPNFNTIVTKEAEDSLIGEDGTGSNGGSRGLFKDGVVLPEIYIMLFPSIQVKPIHSVRWQQIARQCNS
jgi:hypothetical protein